MASFPAALRISIWIEYLPQSVGQSSMKLKIFFADEEMVLVNADITAIALDPAALSVPSFTLNMAKPGDIVVEASFDAEDFT